jgi:hypothetical protein
MGIGTGIVLVVVGLILVLGVVNFDIGLVDDVALGWILLVVGVPDVESASAVIGWGVLRESWCRDSTPARLISRTTSSTWRGVVIETTAPASPARAVRPERCR